MVDIPKQTVILHRSLFPGFAPSPVGRKDIQDRVIFSTRLSFDTLIFIVSRWLLNNGTLNKILTFILFCFKFLMVTVWQKCCTQWSPWQISQCIKQPILIDIRYFKILYYSFFVHVVFVTQYPQQLPFCTCHLLRLYNYKYNAMHPMLAGGPIFAGLLPMNIVQGDSGEWFVIYQYDIHMNACRIEAISIGRFFENEEYRIGFTYHQLLYILQLTWAIGPFPPQLKCPNFGPVNSEVGGINSKRILNGFWGGGAGKFYELAFFKSSTHGFFGFPFSEECSKHGMERWLVYRLSACHLWEVSMMLHYNTHLPRQSFATSAKMLEVLSYFYHHPSYLFHYMLIQSPSVWSLQFVTTCFTGCIRCILDLLWQEFDTNPPAPKKISVELNQV